MLYILLFTAYFACLSSGLASTAFHTLLNSTHSYNITNSTHSLIANGTIRLSKTPSVSIKLSSLLATLSSDGIEGSVVRQTSTIHSTLTSNEKAQHTKPLSQSNHTLIEVKTSPGWLPSTSTKLASITGVFHITSTVVRQPNSTYSSGLYSASTGLPLATGHIGGTRTSNLTWAFALRLNSSSSTLPVATPVDFKTFSNFRMAAAEPMRPKAVFAHFMVGNVPSWTIDNWKADILLAQKAHIDGFALNMAYAELGNEASTKNAFDAADALAFKLIFSFDYAGGRSGPWPQKTVTEWINAYQNRTSYFKRGAQPLVSTFEGPGKAAEWIQIKKDTGAYFMPDWSSKGAKDALTLGGGVVDGLFSWAAWPWGNRDMDTYVDASYKDYLRLAGGKTYMMPVSPWFYTNMPGFDKNWLWRGDDLWRDRWEQVMQVQPDYVQILSWNDYGESHHIGPLRSGTFGAFDKEYGNSPFNYALDMPHDGWRALLPYWIDTYKNNISSVQQETLVAWYRTSPAASTVCSDGGTSANTASQLLIEFSPREVAQDKIFYSAVLTDKLGTPTISVTIGGVDLGATWTDKPFDGTGVWHGSVAYGSRTGQVVVTVKRGSSSVMSIAGRSILVQCQAGLINWNPWVGEARGVASTATPTLSIDKQKCVEGSAPGEFKQLCEFTCKYGYCPIGACQCFRLGKQNTPPTIVPGTFYPAPSLSSSYDGLCQVACNYGNCISKYCGTKEYPRVETTISPFLPPACTGGTAISTKPAFQELCAWTCSFGYCPIGSCKCTGQGTLRQPPVELMDGKPFKPRDGTPDNGLCKWACSRGVCPLPCTNGLKPALLCELDDEREECEPVDFCDHPFNYATFEQVQASSHPEYCKKKYTIQVLRVILQDTINRYNDINNNYDAAFGHYKKHVEAMIQPALEAYMEPTKPGAGNKYVQCTWNENGRNTTTQVCPFNIDKLGQYSWTVYYDVRDRTGFFSELLSTYGIPEAWVKFGSKRKFSSCTSLSCQNEGREQWQYGWPLAADVIDVPNPKEIIASSQKNMFALRDELTTVLDEIMSGTFGGAISDVVEVLSMPVFMIAQAVDSMKEVKDAGEEAAAAEKRNLIMTIVTAVLFFLPIAGEAAIGANLVNIGRIIIVAAIVGETGLAIKDVIEGGAEAAPMAILGLLGLGRIRSPSSYKAAAVDRKKVSANDLGKLGGLFKRHESSLRQTVKACKF